MLLILSHGQSCVERGFSDNKDILGNNIQDETLISYQLAYHGIKNQDGPIEDSVTKQLLVSCRQAHTRYQSCLNQRKENRRGQPKKEEKTRSTGGASVIKKEEEET